MHHLCRQTSTLTTRDADVDNFKFTSCNIHSSFREKINESTVIQCCSYNNNCFRCKTYFLIYSTLIRAAGLNTCKTKSADPCHLAPPSTRWVYVVKSRERFWVDVSKHLRDRPVEVSGPRRWDSGQAGPPSAASDWRLDFGWLKLVPRGEASSGHCAETPAEAQCLFSPSTSEMSGWLCPAGTPPTPSGGSDTRRSNGT